MTQLLAARAGEITPAMRRVAEKEKVPVEEVLRKVAEGRVVIPANKNHANLDPCGIGEGLRTKVNANLGTSPAACDMELELAKLRAALEAGADAVMDLSTGGDLDDIRRAVLGASPVPVGTVPVYQAAVEARERRGSIVAMTPDDLFGVIEKHAADGVDFITVHCGVTLEVVGRLQREGRVTDIVSRGGALLAGWMLHNGKENPLYEQFDRLLEICLRYDVVLSLGDGLRPGCIADATDRAQIQELIVLGELVDRARAAGVQAMVEGPGHVPLDQVAANVQVQKSLCRGAPFYVLGPLVTDVAPGYDHITAAIGGAVAAMAGADFLCYVTPAEHLGLPTVEDVREGVIAARIAAHAADLAKGVPGAREWDLAMSRARKALDWEAQIRLAIDPAKAARYRRERNPAGTKACSMCGEYCAMDVVARYLGREKGEKC
ncbi:phosphomethylpyrimidine synthase ThiC [Desulfovirgula thermocuniculi]|uniref:phosphomethylpyrimidine synthase ThiC n=1 Tax=Desulfovirgula thermocuniculi TaxID=348842 RepID=UPI0003F592CD|nr:phosphomethylpyrimidine synthase ThiC [Desulfovirgula thermocuniculi]